jgi:hypothetical protein
MSRSKTRLRAPALVIAALAALLVFAASASAAAETRTGESTTASTEEAPSGEAHLVNTTASFETATGHAVISFTTAAPPNPANPTEMIGGFSTTECSSTPPSSFNQQSVTVPLIASSPILAIFTGSSEPLAAGITGSFSAPETLLVAKSVSGATTTLSVASSSFIEAGFKFALVIVEGETGASLMTVPIKGPPPPPAPAPVVAPAPAPLPAPAVLSVAKPKPLKVKSKTWKTVHVKVSNTGATATTQGSLRVKAAKGVMVKPEVQKLPVLIPGATYTLSVRVQLTESAKPTSKLPVIVTAPGVSGTGSIVLKLKQ